MRTAPTQKRLGMHNNILLTVDGGTTACDWDQNPIGIIDPEDLEYNADFAVIVHPDSDTLCKTTETYCNRRVWFPDRRFKGERLLRCQLYGECPIECLTIGLIAPAFTSVDLESLRLLAPWSDWDVDERTVPQWDDFVLPREWLSFIEFLALAIDNQVLYDYWYAREQQEVEVYRQHAPRSLQAKPVT